MAYIDKEKSQIFLRTECLAKYPASFANGLLAAADQLNKLPAADVAPKSEVAREIFEEIEKLLECGFSSCHINGTEEQFDFYRADLGF